ncbi:peptidoglycan-binding protein [Solirubrobacter phytolaccae]|uniref:Peptidoglycan-binding protein n=1 Tax=Solirubrobacter phytolaccae TaxID=1404360 RepID=A0A9X3NCE8_9ACTN|nr:peptidoglycan-binding domain-containing protein [Solirubrobacter phytolaccae]MDA0182212.1 peptidoglycan-binding protein [Solirubrobacter phytolaccae]
MHLTRPLIARPRPLRLPRLDGAAAALRAVAVPGSVAGGAPALHARTAQERLAAHGFLPVDAVTGRYDRRTLDALARFQAAHLLPVDGQLDPRTADALLQGRGES